MNQLTLLATVEWIVAFVLALGLLFLSYMITMRLMKLFLKQDTSITSNSSLAIIVSAILIVVGMMVNTAMQPIGEAIRLITNMELQSSVMYFEIAKYISLLLGIAFVASLISCGAGFWLLTIMTRNIDEKQEILDDNWRVGLMIGVVLVMIAFITKDEMVLFMESILPYPDVPSLF